MTKKEAKALEKECEDLIEKIVKEKVEISMALTGKLKIKLIESNDFWTFDERNGEPIYMKFQGFASDFQEYTEKMKAALKDLKFKNKLSLLKWSYENRGELK